MGIQDVGALGELVAALATILTLLYLARQIRVGSEALQSANLSTMIDAMSAMHDTHLQISGFLEDANNGSRELTSSEVSALHVHCVQMFQGFETIFLFHLHGTVEEPYFNARVKTVKRLGMFPYFNRWFREYGSDLFDERFVGFVEKQWESLTGTQTSLALTDTSQLE